MKKSSFGAMIGAALVAGAIGLSGSVSFAGDTTERVAFPKDYATAFSNYLSLDRTQNDDQVIRLFANEKALAAAKAGEPLPSGSVLAAEIYKAVKNDKGEVIESSLGRRVRGPMAAVAVMEKRDGWGKDLAEDVRNGDWDFAIFKPTGERIAGKDINSCRSCHAPLTDTQHLFSLEHLSAK